MKTLKDLFEHQLQDLYSAETQMIEALPKMAEHSKDSKLKQAFEDHLKETQSQQERIVKICNDLGFKYEGEKCKGMEGLIKEAESFMKEDTSEDVLNAGIIADAQRVEHYEISGYGTAVRYAKELKFDEVAEKLQKTLDQEYKADEKLNKLAEERLNKKAMA